jgi:thymidylate synthase (methanogen type)
MEIVANNALEAWRAALAHVMGEGKDFTDPDRRTCREVLNLAIRIERPDLGIDEPVEVVRRINKWVYPSKEELVSIIFNEIDIPLYDYTYGSRLFGYGEELDQINGYIIPLLKKNPSSRRAVALMLDPMKDLRLGNRNAPCLVSLHFKVDEGRLLLTSVIRSNDIFIGWPANVYQLAALQQHVAEELGLKVGALMTYSISAHVFIEHAEDVERVTSP